MPPSNALPMYGNEKTMNLNSLVLANIQASPYFKVYLFDLKTYHQVVDEIYYKVTHLEPWEKGSRKTAGQTGMCGGVRGVGTGGIVSSAFCLLLKLYTLKLTRKQLIGLCTHPDSPFIRGLGLMYIRFTQPPQDLWDWYKPYLDDEEEIDVKAGGGHSLTIGEMSEQLLTKLEWYGTLFPRIPIPIQKTIEMNLAAHRASRPAPRRAMPEDRDSGRKEFSGGGTGRDEGALSFGEAERASRRGADDWRDSQRSSRRSPITTSDVARDLERERSRIRAERDVHSSSHDRRRSPDRRKSPDRDRRRSPERRRSRSIEDRARRRSRSSDRRDRKRSPDSERRRSPDHRRSPDDSRKRSRDRQRSPARDKKSSREHDSGRSRHSPARGSNSRPYDADLKNELDRVRRDRDRK